MQAVIETPIFLADAKAAGITDEERSRIVSHVARTPNSGAEIPGTGGLGNCDLPVVAKGRVVDTA
jgi:hypothetical protein